MQSAKCSVQKSADAQCASLRSECKVQRAKENGRCGYNCYCRERIYAFRVMRNFGRISSFGTDKSVPYINAVSVAVQGIKVVWHMKNGETQNQSFNHRAAVDCNQNKFWTILAWVSLTKS